MREFEMSARRSGLAFALAALSTAAAVHGQPLRLYVDDDAPAGGDGLLWNRAFRRVQDALGAARVRTNPFQPVEIRVAQGNYRAQAGVDGSAAFVLTSGVSLLGGFAGVTAADPSQADPASFVTVLTGDVMSNDTSDPASRADNAQTVVELARLCGRLSGVTISGGSSALRTAGGRAIVDLCRITDNLRTGSQSPSIIELYEGEMTRCVIDGNQMLSAPLIVVTYVTLAQCVIAGNGRLDPFEFSTAVIQCQFNGDSNMVSCLIASNLAPSWEMFRNFGQRLQLIGCTVVDNRGHSSLGNIRAENTIFSRNQPNLFYGIAQNCLFDRIFDNSGTPNLHNLFGDPRFVLPSGPDGDPLTWRDNDYRLNGVSPAIDSGSTLSAFYAVPRTDIVGRTAIDDPLTLNLGSGPVSYLDIGAYEFDPHERCVVDLDSSGFASAADIFTFLNLWFAGVPSADFNASGTLTIADVLDFLNAWFVGC